MFRRIILSAALFAIIPTSTTIAQSDTADAEALLKELRTPRPDTVPYIFDVSYHDALEAEGRGEQETLSSAGSFRVDPSQPAGMRVTLLQAPEPDEDGETDAQFTDLMATYETEDLEELAGEFWCGSSKAKTEEDATLPASQRPTLNIVSRTDETILFGLTPPEEFVLPEELIGESGLKRGIAEKMARNVRLYRELDTRSGFFILERTTIDKPFKPHISMKVKAMDQVTVCALTPDGSGTYAEELTLNQHISAALFLNIKRQYRVSVSNLQPLSVAASEPASISDDAAAPDL
ncbi:MAG: hypothetical protein ABJG15_03970 [Hyphomonadaceae bacterium]